LWKARISAYEEAVKLFGQLDEKEHEWNKFIEIKTFMKNLKRRNGKNAKKL